MGLDITINKEFDFRLGSYSALHRIRASALIVNGDFERYDEANDYLFNKLYKDEITLKNHPFKALINFSDCEGFYLPPHKTLRECFNEDDDIDFEFWEDHPFYIGNSEELFNEMQKFATFIKEHPNNTEIDIRTFNRFWEPLLQAYNKNKELIIQYH